MRCLNSSSASADSVGGTPTDAGGTPALPFLWGARPSRSLCCASRTAAPAALEVDSTGKLVPLAHADSVGGTPTDAGGTPALPFPWEARLWSGGASGVQSHG